LYKNIPFYTIYFTLPKEQIEALMNFIDAKLNKNKDLNQAKLQLIKTLSAFIVRSAEDVCPVANTDEVKNN